MGSTPAGSVPYISPTDLLIFKINSCGLRAQADKKAIDANDAETLLSTMSRPLSLTDDQRGIAETGLADVVANGTMTEDWWRQNLGLNLPAPAAPAGEYWEWSDEYSGWYHMNDDGSCEWATPGDPSTGGGKSSKKSSKGKGDRASSRR